MQAPTRQTDARAGALEIWPAVALLLLMILMLLGRGPVAAAEPPEVELAPATEARAVPIGTRVRWGGMIAAIHAVQDLDPGLRRGLGTEGAGRHLLEIIGFDLDESGRPLSNDEVRGRFLVVTSASLDGPYAPGRELTVTGIVSGQVSTAETTAGQSVPESLPVVRSEYRDLWPDTSQVAQVVERRYVEPRVIHRAYPPPSRTVVYEHRPLPALRPDPFWALAPLTVAAALLADHTYVSLRYGSGYGDWGYRGWHGRHHAQYPRRVHHWRGGHRQHGWGRPYRHHRDGRRSSVYLGFSGGF
ncbi:MAG: Slp family lipoprotein [Gammaproteobacteria bacterium]|nr:Slp family lipoprotein [Gammaproteobacteria bacterium]